MECKKCLYQNEPGAKYCKHCGAQLSIQQREENTSDTPQTPKRKKLPKWAIALIIIGICSIVLPLAIIAAVLIPTFSGVTAKANEKSALLDARNALSTYIANTSSGDFWDTSFSIEENTVFVVEKAGKYYNYMYIEGRLEQVSRDGSFGRGASSKPFDGNGMYHQDVDANNLANMPTNVKIYLPNE